VPIEIYNCRRFLEASSRRVAGLGADVEEETYLQLLMASCCRDSAQAYYLCHKFPWQTLILIVVSLDWIIKSNQLFWKVTTTSTWTPTPVRSLLDFPRRVCGRRTLYMPRLKSTSAHEEVNLGRCFALIIPS
jgi:hypothetical protein